MNLRKEPVLFTAVLLLGAWIGTGGESTTPSGTARAATKDPEVVPAPVVVLADPNARVAPAEVFREPTEAVPLPPTDLPFPALAPLPIVAPPLPGGTQASSYYLHRIPGGPATEHQFKASGGTPENGGGDPDPVTAPVPTQSGLTEEELNRRFDSLWLEHNATPMWGTILNQDKLAIPLDGPFSTPLRFQHVAKSSGKPSGLPQDIEPTKIKRIAFADNLENRIALRRRELSMGQESVTKRIELIDFLLGAARDETWVWAEAEKEAQDLIGITKDERGYLQMLRVLRAEGDLGKEYALYQTLPADFADSAFRWREQGRLEARLGLDVEAEAHFRVALQKMSTAALGNHAFAEFLLARGRAAEALRYAEQAGRSTSGAFGQDEMLAFATTLAAVRLALADVRGAEDAMSRISGRPSETAVPRGVIAYCAGKVEEAALLFERAVGESGDPVAIYGLGAARLRLGEWDEARTLLERVRDSAPTLRARALAALGLLYERTGHPDEAANALEQAERVDPTDPWVLYMRGRGLRAAGQLDEALDTLRRATLAGDDFVEALAECAAVLLEKADRSDADATESLAAAARYLDRVVALDLLRTNHVPFVEAQGYVYARVGESVRARRAFESVVDRGSDFAKIGLAILDYRSKRTTAARDLLATMQGDGGVAAATRAITRDLVDRIDDHASKEQVRDNFAREELGLWVKDGALMPLLKDDELVFRGNTSPVGGETFVRRTLKRAGGFLRTEVAFRLASDASTTTFAGLRITNPARGQDFLVEIGLRRRSAGLVPELRLQDGSSRNPTDTQEPILLTDLQLDLSGRQDLAIEVTADPEDPSSNRLGLRVYWNGRLVHEVASMKMLNTRASFELATDLVVQGKPVHVAFDDYRLVRRKEIQ